MSHRLWRWRPPNDVAVCCCPSLCPIPATPPPSHVTHDNREQFVIAPHHPDRLRRPAPTLGGASAERFAQAVAWNIFRTLELVTPSFWLRRLHLRLTGEPSTPAPVRADGAVAGLLRRGHPAADRTRTRPERVGLAEERRRRSPADGQPARNRFWLRVTFHTEMPTPRHRADGYSSNS